MKTYLDCIPCFFKQGLNTARIAEADEKIQKQVLDEIARQIPNYPLTKTPPEMGKEIYQIVKKLVGNRDPFEEIKKKSNRLAMEIAQDFLPQLQKSEDRLLTAIKLAIIGNIIDYGAITNFNIEKLEKEIFENLEKQIQTSDYEKFLAELSYAKEILYLGDNAGEIVFDKIFIEEITREFPDVTLTFVVRNAPVINDVLLADAEFCGLDKIVEVISNGADYPGTFLEACSEDFMKRFEEADLIISKGQGNFESLSEADAPIYFLFRVKCPVVTKHVQEVGKNVKLGDMVLLKKSRE